MTRALTRPLLILAAFVLGFFCPRLGEFKGAVKYLLILMLYFSCVNIRLAELKLRAAHWRILAFNLLFAIAVWGGFRLFAPRLLADACFFTAVAPTANAAPVIMGFLGGNVPFVVTAVLVTNLGIALAFTVLLPLVTGNFQLGFLAKVVCDLFLVVGIPILAAAATRRFYQDKPALRKGLGQFSFLLWIGVLLILTASTSGVIRSGDGGLTLRQLLLIGALSLLICACNFTVGKLLGGSDFRRESSQSLGQKNTTFTVLFALNYAGPAAAMGPAFYILWHNLWNGAQMLAHDLRARREASPAPPPNP